MASTPTNPRPVRRTRPEPASPRGRVAAWIAAALAAGLVVSGCGYTTSPSFLPSHLKTVAIPTFENASTEAALEQDVTDAVIQAFVRDNHLKIVDEKSANAVLRGKITGYKNTVFGFTTTSQANEYRVTIVVQVTLKDLVKNRELWSDEIEKSANYYVQPVPGQEVKTELDGRKEAIAKIADEILSRSVEGW